MGCLDCKFGFPGRWVVLTLAMGSHLLAGCGGSGIGGTSPVSGTVTYNGQPVADASITFIYDDQNTRPATAASGPDGRYELMTLESKGALPGKGTVLVRKTDMPAELTKTQTMDEAAAQANVPLPTPKDLLPTKYGDPVNSPLKFEIKSGSNTIDLPLAD